MRALLVTWGVTLALLGLAAVGLARWPEAGGRSPDRAPEAAAPATPEGAAGGDLRAPAPIPGEENVDHPAATPSHDVPTTADGDEERAISPASPAGGPMKDASAVDAGKTADENGGLPFALAPVPDPALIEKTPEGLLPTRGADGRSPWQAYSRPFLADPSLPRIALVVVGVGLSERRTRAAIEDLPGEVTLAFSPYGRRLQDRARMARAHGHETLVMVPMEPRDYPANDPGPLGLLTKLTPAQNLQRLRRILGRFAGHVGIVNDMGSRFTAEREVLAPVIAELGRRGLLVLDARTTARSRIPELARRFGVPFARNDRHIDNVARGEEIDRYLAELETLARRRGKAVGIGHPYPVTIERIRAFAEGLPARGLVLAPLSAVVETPGDGDGSAQ